MTATLIIGALFAVILAFIPAAIVLWVVSKLGLGISVSGCGSALIGAMVIALLNGLVNMVLGITGLQLASGGLAGLVVQTVISAIVLLMAGALLPGVSVKGFTGALVAALAIGVVGWLLGVLFAALGLAALFGIAVA